MIKKSLILQIGLTLPNIWTQSTLDNAISKSDVKSGVLPFPYSERMYLHEETSSYYAKMTRSDIAIFSLKTD